MEEDAAAWKAKCFDTDYARMDVPIEDSNWHVTPSQSPIAQLPQTAPASSGHAAYTFPEFCWAGHKPR
ncbi:hypothetical protein PG994_001936 [Apiospora phragmitis]|uniref:Uncharacterized protein n=1 Tax=Apiospora phragmitis TaxID=2905665 RepID=A0ABR1WUY3_9PEZI